MAHLTTWLAYFIMHLTLAASTVIILHWIATRNYDYWRHRDVPYIHPYPIVGSMFEAFRKPFYLLDQEWYKQCGKIYGYFEGKTPILSVADPVLIKNILVSDFHVFTGRRKIVTGDHILDKTVFSLQGKDWKRVRSIITPTFTTGKLKRMVKIFKECSQTCVNNFMKYAEEETSVDLKEIFGAFSMDVIASSAFSTKLDSHGDPNNKFVTAARLLLTKQLTWRMLIFGLLPKIQRAFRISIISPSQLDFFKKTVLQIIEERSRTNTRRNDFLQLLLDTAEEVDEEESQKAAEKEDVTANYWKDDLNEQLFKNLRKLDLSKEEIIAQCILFFIVGYDTTASTLAFVCYYMALNPDVQNKLIAEIDQTLMASDGEVTYESLLSMKYLDNVISETQRLYSPAVRLERRANQDYMLGDTGILVAKGTLITIPIYAIHNDPKYFPEPEKFDPDRFSPEERAKRDPYVYMPFGCGPRNCIGMRFSLLEIKMCLLYFFNYFRVEVCPETQIPVQFHIAPGFNQPKEIEVQLKVRMGRPQIK